MLREASGWTRRIFLSGTIDMLVFFSFFCRFWCSLPFAGLRPYATLRSSFVTHLRIEHSFSSIFYARFRFLCFVAFPLAFRVVFRLGLREAPEGFPDGTDALHQRRAAAAHRVSKSLQPCGKPKWDAHKCSSTDSTDSSSIVVV